MAIPKEVLYATLSSIVQKRQDLGYSTDVRALRAVLEYGAVTLDRANHWGFIGRNWFAQEFTGFDPSCWINLRGMRFHVDCANHSTFCGLLVGDRDTNILEQAGWVHVSDCRIDLRYDPTPYQQRAIDELLALGEGWRVEDLRRIGDSRAPGHYLVPRELEIAPLSDCDWQSPRYWEDRGIPRDAHGVRAGNPLSFNDKATMLSTMYSEQAYKEISR